MVGGASCFFRSLFPKHRLGFNFVQLWQADNGLYVLHGLSIFRDVIWRQSLLEGVQQAFPDGLNGKHAYSSRVDTYFKTDILYLRPPKIRASQITMISSNISIKLRPLESSCQFTATH